MTILSFKNISTSRFIIRTVIVLAIASAGGEFIFHLNHNWQVEIAFWRIVVESMLIIFVFTPLLWLYVLRPLQEDTEGKSRKTERELLSLMEATFESTADGIVVLNTDMQVVRYNQKYIQMWGDEAAEVFACGDAYKIFDCVKAKLDNPELFYEHSLLAYSHNEQSYSDEVCFKDGRIFERYTQPQKNDSVIIGWVSSYRDVTEKQRAEKALRESEERFRQIVEQSNDALFLCTPEGTVIDMNRSAIDLFGYSKEEFYNNSVFSLFEVEDGRMLASTADASVGHYGCTIPKLSASCKNGDSVFISMLIKSIELTGERLLLFRMNDITDKVNLDEHSRNIQAKLIQANKMTSLGLLVSGIAHEINNPNNYIMITSELLSRAWKDSLPVLREHKNLHGDFMVSGVPFASFEAEAQDLIDGITEGSRRIRDIVNSLKDFSRDNKGGHENSVDINQVVNTATTIIAHHIKRTTNRFELDLAPLLPPVAGNKHQLEQVVINIILNSLQSLSSPDEAVKVSTRLDSRGENILVIIEDQGCGISKETSKLIMEPFFTTKLDSGGTGLGLSICRTIVHEHNGTICFTTEPGNGTVFTLQFPVYSRIIHEVTSK